MDCAELVERADTSVSRGTLYVPRMANKNSTSVFAYLRVSSNGQVKGHGFQRQEETICRFAEENGVSVTEVFRDTFTGNEADRPEFNRMVATILGNGVRTILVESLDRLTRDVMVPVPFAGETCTARHYAHQLRDRKGRYRLHVRGSNAEGSYPNSEHFQRAGKVPSRFQIAARA